MSLAQIEERTSFIQANGRTLRARFLNPAGSRFGEGPTLVFLHEGLGCIEQWREIPRLLAEATGLGALVYDRYGFGGSEPLREPRDRDYLEREALDSLPEVLAACGINEPILIGHSDGGTIALLYAAKFPGRPTVVVTEAAHVFVEEVTVAGVREAVALFESGGLREKLVRFHGERTDAMFRGWSDVWLAPAFRDWNIEERLARIRCPVLALQGENDEYGTVAQLESIIRGVSGQVEGLLISDCGHIPHLQSQERVLREMTNFIAKLT